VRALRLGAEGQRPVSRKLLSPALVLAIFVADRLTKAWALDVLRYLPGRAREVAPFVKLTYAENTGVAFGMFHGNNHFFIAVSVILVAALLFWRRKIAAHGAAAECGLALVLAGALGNIYDRINYGFVADFIDLSFFPAVFNVADSSITVGAALLAFGVKDLPQERKS
jgi:signal peptidase II